MHLGSEDANQMVRTDHRHGNGARGLPPLGDSAGHRPAEGATWTAGLRRGGRTWLPLNVLTDQPGKSSCDVSLSHEILLFLSH